MLKIDSSLLCNSHEKKRLKERHEKREGERLKERRERVIAWVGVSAMNSECVTVRVCVYVCSRNRSSGCVCAWVGGSG